MKADAVLKKKIKARALKKGADLIGFCEADSVSSARKHFLRSERSGLTSSLIPAGMKTGFEPERLLPGARSFIVAGLSYYTGEEEQSKPAGLAGKLARYARVRDYHYLLREILQDIVSFLKRSINEEFNYRIFIDSGPVPEKTIAFQAGLGFRGRNNLIINPRFGSWIVFGELLTDINFDPDKPLDLNCGNCQRCKLVCPTGALCSSGDYNPGICFSELTQINHLPTELYRPLGNRLWGCDTCQEVCPYNQTATPTNNQNVLRSYLGSYLPLADLFELSNREFKNKYREYPFIWRGKKPLQRNAAVILGNYIRMKRYISTAERAEIDQLLAEIDQDPKPEVQSPGRWARLRLEEREKVGQNEKNK